MSLEPGDVVVADFPGATQVKRRPAVVVSSAAYHAARPDAILAVLTSHLAAATSATDYVLCDWRAAGLHRPSAFRTYLATARRTDVSAPIGHLSDEDWAEVHARVALAFALAVPDEDG